MPRRGERSESKLEASADVTAPEEAASNTAEEPKLLKKRGAHRFPDYRLGEPSHRDHRDHP